MPDETELESATNLAVTLAWVAGAVVAAYLLGVVLTWVLSASGAAAAVLDDIAALTRMPVRATLMVFAASIAVQRTSDQARSWRGWVDHTLLILLIATHDLAADAASSRSPSAGMIARYGGGDDEISDADRRWRRIRTQVTVLRRLAIAVVVILGVAAILDDVPGVLRHRHHAVRLGRRAVRGRGPGRADVARARCSRACRSRSPGAIRVGDVVELEQGQWWGRIEEITLTYVVVRLWDERRLVLPCTYFTTTPFENWTRNATEIMGTVEFDVDFSVPFDDMRAELDRLLSESEQWDGRRGVLQVTDAVGGVVRVRMVVSAPNAGALFDLRCAVREGMVDWVHARAAWCRRNASSPRDACRRSRQRRRDGDGETKRVASEPLLRQPRGRRAGAGRSTSTPTTSDELDPLSPTAAAEPRRPRRDPDDRVARRKADLSHASRYVDHAPVSGRIRRHDIA